MVDEHVVSGTALGIWRSAQRADKTMGYTIGQQSLTDTLKRTRTSGQVDWGVCGLQGPVRNGLGPDSHAKGVGYLDSH